MAELRMNGVLLNCEVEVFLSQQMLLRVRDFDNTPDCVDRWGFTRLTGTVEGQHVEWPNALVWMYGGHGKTELWWVEPYPEQVGQSDA